MKNYFLLSLFLCGFIFCISASVFQLVSAGNLALCLVNLGFAFINGANFFHRLAKYIKYIKNIQ